MMKRCSIIAAIAAWFLGGAVLQGHAGPAREGGYRAKAMAFLAAGVTPQSGSNPDFTVKLVDLNGDGIPEALAIDQSVDSCGSHGCAAYILDLTGPKARSMADLLGFDLSALQTKTDGWRDVVLSSTRKTKLVHRGDKYVFSR